MTYKTYRIAGMHCPACVEINRKALSRVPGVASVDVQLKGETARIGFEGAEPDVAALTAAVAEAGYSLTADVTGGKVADRGRAFKDWVAGALIAGAVVVVYLLIQRTGLVESFAPDGTDVTPLFGLGSGLVASVSTCFALVGSFVLALGQNAKRSPHPLRQAVRTNLAFHGGRVVSFVAFGAALGLIGGGLRLSGTALGWYTMVVAVAIGLSGLSILGLRLPGLSRGRLSAFMDRLSLSNSPAAAAGLGALTFFLPCGFTLSMQVIALASRSPGIGAMILGSFALGTLPVLFAAGLGSTWVGGRRLSFLRNAVGLLVIAFAGITFASGQALSAFTGDIVAAAEPSPAASGSEGTAVAVSGAQVVEMRVTYEGFEPSTIDLQANRPVEWVIWGDEVTGCTNRIIIPDLGVQQRIGPGKNIVSFTAPAPGTLRFSCWMGMVRGVFVVE